MRTLSIIFTLSFSLSLFSLRDAERREQRIGYAHASLSLYVFFLETKSPIFFLFSLFVQGVSREEKKRRREEERSPLSRGDECDEKSLCLLLSAPPRNKQQTKKKFEVSSQVPRSQRAPLHTTKFFFFIHLKSHLTFDDDYDDDDEQQQQ